MSGERVETTLRFVGEWPWWLGGAVAVALGVLAWVWYRREVRHLAWKLGWGLPTLRALAVAMAVLMLSGPVLHHRKTIGELSKLLIFVDGSKSMGLPDAQMSLGRKITILQRLGLLGPDVLNADLAKAADLLAEAQGLAEKGRDSKSSEEEAFRAVAGEVRTKVDQVWQLLSAQGAKERAERFGRELVAPAGEIAGRKFKQIDDRTRAANDLGGLVEVSRRWQEELSGAFQKLAEEAAAGDGAAVQVALRKFESLTRIQRVQAWLLGGKTKPVLEELAERHDVQLLMLEGGEGRKLWQPEAKSSALPLELPKPLATMTDLATGIKVSLGDQSIGRTAVVLFSDGQHNEGEAPVELAKTLGARQIPIYAIGVGSQTRPPDLAILKLEGPDTVFFQDRVRGEVTLKEDMPVGRPFKVTVSDGNTVLWEQALNTEGKQIRKVAYEFGVNELVSAKLAAAGGLQFGGIPLDLTVSVSQIEGDSEPKNNESHLRLRAVTQKRKILILDGRPRWETRYLRNLFERDEQWEVNTVIAGSRFGKEGFPRGSAADEFPESSSLLQSYDLIFFGELAPSLLKEEEMQWIQEFVSQRGGALVFLDGARAQLREYAGGPLGSLFPVEWNSSALRNPAGTFTLSGRGATMAPFILASEKTHNAEVWAKLPAPHWLAGPKALPGAETLLEILVQGQKIAGVVYRPFGAGKVLYHGFDESWRWRYEIGDEHHTRYWNQIANWLVEQPFAVRDKFVSLDAGLVTYQPGESAEIRLRLRDGEGKPVRNASLDAILNRDGKKVATIRLVADENSSGLFRGQTAPLEPGQYEVGLEAAAIPASELKARTQFTVEAKPTGELTLLNLNEELLRQVADQSGGQYLREENSDRLVQLLAPMSQGRVIELDTALWQSYAWFIPLMALLSIEWFIRKRVGLL